MIAQSLPRLNGWLPRKVPPLFQSNGAFSENVAIFLQGFLQLFSTCQDLGRPSWLCKRSRLWWQLWLIEANYTCRLPLPKGEQTVSKSRHSPGGKLARGLASLQPNVPPSLLLDSRLVSEPESKHSLSVDNEGLKSRTRDHSMKKAWEISRADNDKNLGEFQSSFWCLHWDLLRNALNFRTWHFMFDENAADFSPFSMWPALCLWVWLIMANLLISSFIQSQTPCKEVTENVKAWAARAIFWTIGESHGSNAYLRR